MHHPADDDQPTGAVRRSQVSTRDPREAASAYAEALGGGRLAVVPGDDDFSFRTAAIGDDRVTLRTSESTGGLTGEIAHLQEYVVGWFRHGAGTVDGGRSARAHAGSAPFLLPAERRFTIDLGPHRQHLVHLAPAFLEDVATELHGGPAEPVSFDHAAEPAAGVLARWRAAVSATTTALVDAVAAPLVRLDAERGLARALLALFPWRVWAVPAALRLPSAAKARAALDYLQHHAAEAITPADAARAAGLHTRTLQQATRHHLGISPSEYLRDVRLDRARAELQRGEPGATTVAGVARAWGFGNLGRFAGAYALRFGERPSETLRHQGPWPRSAPNLSGR